MAAVTGFSFLETTRVTLFFLLLAAGPLKLLASSVLANAEVLSTAAVPQPVAPTFFELLPVHWLKLNELNFLE